MFPDRLFKFLVRGLAAFLKFCLLASWWIRVNELYVLFKVARNASDFAPPLRVFIRSALAPRRRVLCAPHSLRNRMVLAKIFAINRYRPVLSPDSPYDFSIHVPATSGRINLNGRHKDNKKSRVAEAWATAAGYPLAVDPTTYSESMVEKSEANATHDGRVVNGPLRPEEIKAGKVYQILVDNSEGDSVIDLRVALYGGQVPLVYVKRRPIEDRFSNTNTIVEVRAPSELFSQQEIETISRFSEIVGLDYGEADVLRDNANGRIYIVDSTNGPAGPPNGLPSREARAALHQLASAFEFAADTVGGRVM